MRCLYLDCFSGVSGNMLLAALLDLGLDQDLPTQVAHDLGLTDIEVETTRRSDQGLSGLHIRIRTTRAQPTRHLADIRHLILNTSLSEPIQARSLAVFQRLAEAEAQVHGTVPDAIHFHEVGAADALVDIVATITALHRLDVQRLICSPLPLANGWTICAHGPIPLPSPAVTSILQGVPVYGVDLDLELVTPTGAALVRELADTFGPMPAMTLEAVGYGSGSHRRTDQRPNLLRACLGWEEEVEESQEVMVLETLLDDWNLETWPHVSSLFLEQGALDVNLTPLLMKKGRPGHRLEVICSPELSPALQDLIFRETSAIGLRMLRTRRRTLKRWPVRLTTPWGEVEGKAVLAPDGVRVTPEYESCRSLAEKHGLAIGRIYQAALRSTTGDSPEQGRKDNPE